MEVWLLFKDREHGVRSGENYEGTELSGRGSWQRGSQGQTVFWRRLNKRWGPWGWSAPPPAFSPPTHPPSGEGPTSTEGRVRGELQGQEATQPLLRGQWITSEEISLM